MEPLPPGPTSELRVEWRAAGLRCRLRPTGLMEPALDVLAEAAFLWLFGSSLALVGAVVIGLACVVAMAPMEQPLALAAAASLAISTVLGLRGLGRWLHAQLYWVVELDGSQLVAERYIGRLRVWQWRWPLEEVRAASWSGDGLKVLAGSRRMVLRTDESPADLRWLVAAIHRARRSRANFWRQVLGRPRQREALMRLLVRTTER